MRGTKNKFYHRISPIIVALMFFSCVSISNPDIYGRWQRVEGEGMIELRRDGSFTGVDNMGATFKGNYTINNENIKLEITHSNIMRETITPEISPEIVNAKISINDDELQFMFISDKENKVEIERYRRDKSYR